jgi:hypothetical protein
MPLQIISASLNLLNSYNDFLYDQANPGAEILSADVSIDECPYFGGSISIYHSAIARFYAPSDLCGAGRMYQKWICSSPNWCGEYV